MLQKIGGHSNVRDPVNVSVKMRFPLRAQQEMQQWLKACDEKEQVNKALGISKHKESIKIKELAHDLER